MPTRPLSSPDTLYPILLPPPAPPLAASPLTTAPLTTAPLTTAPLTASIFMPRRPSRIPKVNTSQVHNRILALMAHTSGYAFKGESRLAKDAGVSKSAVCRLLNGQSSPSFALVSSITRALEPHLQRGLQGHRLDPHELISLDGTYPTASAGCKGCLPAEAYDEHNRLKPEFRDMRPGEWSLSPATPSALREPGREAV
jgi:hypothetical protein